MYFNVGRTAKITHTIYQPFIIDSFTYFSVERATKNDTHTNSPPKLLQKTSSYRNDIAIEKKAGSSRILPKTPVNDREH